MSGKKLPRIGDTLHYYWLSTSRAVYMGPEPMIVTQVSETGWQSGGWVTGTVFGSGGWSQGTGMYWDGTPRLPADEPLPFAFACPRECSPFAGEDRTAPVNMRLPEGFEPGRQTTVTVEGEPFRCKCGANVFTEYAPRKYRCNACRREWEGEPESKNDTVAQAKEKTDATDQVGDPRVGTREGFPLTDKTF